MHFIHTLVRFFPYWALPLGLVSIEVGNQFRRLKKPKNLQYTAWGIGGMLFSLVVLWFVFRGDIYSDNWVKAL